MSDTLNTPLKELTKELSDFILRNKPDYNSINNKKISLASKYKLNKIPLNSEILKYVDEKDKKKIIDFLVVKDVRSKSGVNVIAVMTKPSRCPHGKCIYCPGGMDEKVPQSYTGFEPAAMRAIANNYDPYKQVKNRVLQLENVGHDVSKIELIIMGGTFNAQPIEYQTYFIKRIYDAISNRKNKDLDSAKLAVEKSLYRPVGLTIETRPDFCSEKDIECLLNFGTTRVEVGVQTLSDDVYKKVNRGHKLVDVVTATQLLKDSGLKVLYHIMPGLFKTPKEDVKMYSQLFSNAGFRPDMLKIYPVLVMPKTILFDMWKRNEFEPYNDANFFNFLKDFYPLVPNWVRIMRIQRDIPLTRVSAGPRKANMREIVLNYLRKNNIPLNEIRSKQLGIVKPESENFKSFVEKYMASKGTEYFISYESDNRDTLVGFLRLRFPYKPFIEEIKDSALVRELHVYGKLIPVHKKSGKIGQHQGVGKKLLRKAEEIAKEHGYKKISVISGLGVREYYYNLGYFRDKYYVSKYL